MKHITIIEDDDALRLGISLILEAHGFKTSTYADNDDLLTHPPESQPDLYLIDYRLPGPDGLEITRQIRQSDQKVPIIILSAGGDNLAEKVKSSSANMFIRKPFEIDYLLEAVRSFSNN